MKLINHKPMPPLPCNFPSKNGKCPNACKHLVTIQKDPPILKFASYRVCDGHLKVIMDRHAQDNP